MATRRRITRGEHVSQVQLADRATYRQELCYCHLLLIFGMCRFGQRRQLHCRWPRGHQHHGEPQQWVITQQIRLGYQRRDDGNAHPAPVISKPSNKQTRRGGGKRLTQATPQTASPAPTTPTPQATSPSLPLPSSSPASQPPT